MIINRGGALLEFKQLEVFVQVVNDKSFSKAAEKLYLTQPSVSQHIILLEQELNTKLIIRTTKTVYPSKAGKLLYRYAQEMLSTRRRALEMLRQSRCDFDGNVTIGAVYIYTRHLLPPLMADFSNKYKKVQYQIFSNNSINIVQKIIAGDVEVGFTGILVQSSHCISKPLTDDKWIIITPNRPDYRQFVKEGFPVTQIPLERFICREPGSGTRKDMDQFLEYLELDVGDLQIIAELDDTESIISLVSAGMGISIVSKRAAEVYCRSGDVLMFDFNCTTPRRMLYITCHKHNVLSPVAQLFYNFALSYYASDCNEINYTSENNAVDCLN